MDGDRDQPHNDQHDDAGYYFPPADVIRNHVLVAVRGAPIPIALARELGLVEGEVVTRLDRQQRRDWYDRVIARYNRAHGQNPTTTLRDICVAMGAPYEAVRKRRLRTGKNKRD